MFLRCFFAGIMYISNLLPLMIGVLRSHTQSTTPTLGHWLHILHTHNFLGLLQTPFQTLLPHFLLFQLYASEVSFVLSLFPFSFVPLVSSSSSLILFSLLLSPLLFFSCLLCLVLFLLKMSCIEASIAWVDFWLSFEHLQ